MALNPRIGNLDSPNFDTKLLLNDLETLNLESFDSLKSEMGVMTVQSLQREAQKEINTLRIEESSFKRLSRASEEMKGHLENVAKLKKIIQDNKLNVKANKGNLTPLPVEFKRSLKKVYEAYYALSSNRKVLLGQLKNVERDVSLNEKVLAKRSPVSKIGKSLEIIHWDSPSIRLKKEDSGISPDKKNFFGWGRWNQNPFHWFFDKPAEFLKIADRADKAHKLLIQKSLSNVKNQGAWTAAAGSPFLEHLFKDEEQFRSQFEDIRIEVETRISEKLLKIMGLSESK